MQRTRFLIWLFLGLFTAFLYGRTVTFDFAYDDALQIIHNPQVNTGICSLASLLRIFSEPTPPGNLYRPIATLSYALTVNAAGSNPGIFHLTNVALYWILCGLVFELLSLTFGGLLAAVAATLYLVHPLHVEAVASIVGRAEMLAGIFALAGTLAFRRALLAEKARALSLWSVGSGALFLMALLSKESTLPIVFLGPLLVWKSSAGPKPAWYKALPAYSSLVGAILVMLVLRYGALEENFVMKHSVDQIWPENPLAHLSFFERLIPAVCVLGRYILNHVAPVALAVDYSSMPATLFSEVYSLNGALQILLVILLVALMVIRRNEPGALYGLWFFGAFALTCNIFVPIGTIMGDRLALVPGIGLIGFLSWAASRSCFNRWAPAAASIFIVAFAFLTWQRTSIWADNGTLFRASLEENNNSPKAHFNFAVQVLKERGDDKLAESHFRAAIEIHPEYILAMKSLADLLLARQEFGALEYWYRRLLKVSPNDAGVQENLRKLLEFKQQKRAG